VAEAHYELVLRTYWRWLFSGFSVREEDVLMPFFKVKRHYIRWTAVLHGIPLRKRCLQRRQTNSKTRRLKGSAELQWKYALELYGLVTRSGLSRAP
jgi:hypothetical protein